MIKVLIKQEGKNFKSLEVKGHAKSAEAGKDLVCAGVSSVLTGGLNNLENPKDFDIILEEGHARIEALKTISQHDEVVMETIITGLKTIEESYSKFIQIKNL